jgi:hypothetical protein
MGAPRKSSSAPVDKKLAVMLQNGAGDNASLAGLLAPVTPPPIPIDQIPLVEGNVTAKRIPFSQIPEARSAAPIRIGRDELTARPAIIRARPFDDIPIGQPVARPAIIRARPFDDIPIGQPVARPAIIRLPEHDQVLAAMLASQWRPFK